MKGAKNKPLTLSLIIPAYNEQRYLESCLDSIKNQTVKPSEVIVVDNGSKDKTAAIARKYKFVRVITENKKGVVHARNTGFDSAKGQLIGRIDADTILPPDWVDRVQNFYKKSSQHTISISGTSSFYNVRLPRFSKFGMTLITFGANRLLLGHSVLYGANMVIPKEVWRTVKSKTCKKKTIHEDLDLAIHVHRAGYQIKYRRDIAVSVNMRRVRSRHDELWKNMKMWPDTLHHHGKNTWIFGYGGAILLFVGSPLINWVERVARILGNKPLVD